MAFWKRKNEGFISLVRESEKTYHDPLANALNQVIGGVWNEDPLLTYWWRLRGWAKELKQVSWMVPLGFACSLLGREGRDIDLDNRAGGPETPDKKQRDCSYWVKESAKQKSWVSAMRIKSFGWIESVSSLFGGAKADFSLHKTESKSDPSLSLSPVSSSFRERLEIRLKTQFPKGTEGHVQPSKYTENIGKGKDAVNDASWANSVHSC